MDGRALAERTVDLHVPARHAQTAGGPPEASLLGIVNVGLRHRALVLLTAVATVAVVTAATLLSARTYSATGQFIPQNRRAGSNLSGLAAQFGVSLPGGEPGQSPQFYVDLIGSRDVLRQLAGAVYEGGGFGGVPPRRAPLSEWLGVREPDARRRQAATEARLRKNMTTRAANGSGIVSLRVRAPDPAVAQQIASRALAALDAFNREQRQSQAAAERAFTSRRLAEARAELRDAENRLQRFLAANRGFGEASALRVEQDRLAREVALRQQLFGSIAESYEQARIEEVRDTPLLTVIERPAVPAEPDPRYTVLRVALGGVFGLLLGLLVAVVRDYLARETEDPGDVRTEFAALRRETLADVRHPLRAVRRVLASPRAG